MIKQTIKKTGMIVIALSMGMALFACDKENTGVAECDQVFEKASSYIESLPASEQQTYNTQLDALKKQIEQDKTQAKTLCESALSQFQSQTN